MTGVFSWIITIEAIVGFVAWFFFGPWWRWHR